MQESRAKARVLVVEDSLTQAKKLEVILRSVGFDVTLARDGRQGAEAFRDAAAPFEWPVRRPVDHVTNRVNLDGTAVSGLHDQHIGMHAAHDALTRGTRAARVGLDTIVKDAVELKFTAQPLTREQLAELIQIPAR